MSTDRPMTRERILRILDSQAQKTAQAIAGLDEATLNRPARADGWTAKELLAHMASGHEGMLALAQGRIPGGFEWDSFNLDEYNEVQRRRASAMSLAEVLAWLDQARQATRAAIEQEDESRFGQMVSTPWMGDHPRGQLLVFPALHEGGHRVELEQWRASLGADQG